MLTLYLISMFGFIFSRLTQGCSSDDASWGLISVCFSVESEEVVSGNGLFLLAVNNY